VRLTLVAALACAHLAGCATAELGRGTLRGSAATGLGAAEVPVRGFGVVVTTVSGTVEGELLAVDEDALWVRTIEGRSVPIARRGVLRVRVQVEDTSGGSMAAWTTTGTLLTASHGLMLAITAPLWLLVGIPASALESASGRADVEPRDFDRLHEYARFPQGPPPMLTGEPTAPEPTAPEPTEPGASAPGAPAPGSPPEGWPTATPAAVEGAEPPPVTDAAVAPVDDASADAASADRQP
jgi:hypothetical protein